MKIISNSKFNTSINGGGAITMPKGVNVTEQSFAVKKMEKFSNNVNAAVDTAGNVVSGVVSGVFSFGDFLAWLITNWQAAILGALALLLLIKRL